MLAAVSRMRFARIAVVALLLPLSVSSMMPGAAGPNAIDYGRIATIMASLAPALLPAMQLVSSNDFEAAVGGNSETIFHYIMSLFTGRDAAGNLIFAILPFSIVP